MSNDRILEIATIIKDETVKLNQFLASEGLSTFSFEPDAPVTYDLPLEIESSRQRVLEATDELHALLLGPIGILTTPYFNSTLSRQAICRFQMATSFPEGKEVATYEEISQSCNLNVDIVKRMLRTAMTDRIFQESPFGQVMHTTASRLLATNPKMRQWTEWLCDVMIPSASRTVDALVKWPGSQEPNQTGFNLALNTEDTMFANLSANPALAKRFAEAMSLFSAERGFEPRHLLDNYDWSSFGHSTVVDVGGSSGFISIPLAERFPSLHCIVQDRSEVVASAEVPQGLEGRLEFFAHDFFTEQPVKGAAVYLFRWIFHDWSDNYAALILRALIPALKEGARIVICERVLPEPGTVPPLVEREARAMDLGLLGLYNAKERDASDWASLLQDADPRFKLLAIKQPSGSRLAIIDVIWKSEQAKESFLNTGYPT